MSTYELLTRFGAAVVIVVVQLLKQKCYNNGHIAVSNERMAYLVMLYSNKTHTSIVGGMDEVHECVHVCLDFVGHLELCQIGPTKKLLPNNCPAMLIRYS